METEVPEASAPIDDRAARRGRVSSLARRIRSAARIPIDAVLVGGGLFAVLAAFAAADPIAGITSSSSPFADEAWNVVNARNFVQLGTWSTDEWNLHLVNLPFSLFQALNFEVFGVGIVQARLAMILCVSLAAAALVWGLRDVVGRTWAAFAGLAFGASGLILFYGRLAFLEDMVVLGLTLGTLVLARDSRIGLRGGLLSGVCFAVAIGTKPSAVFAVAGILVAMTIAWGWRDRGMRRWIIGCTGVIAAAGLLWAVVIALPNQTALAADTRIWPPYQWNLTPAALVDSVWGFLTTRNDYLYSIVLLPLIVLGATGCVSIIALRKRLGKVEARLAVAAFGWAAFGFGILTLVTYRPNRYDVPLVPALAILAAIGLHLFCGWLPDKLANRRTNSEASETNDVPAAATGVGTASRNVSRLPSIVAAAAIVIAVAPGLVWYGGWARTSDYAMVDIQNRFADAVPQGQMVVGGDSALWLMRSRATTVVIGLANNGDLYAGGARWYLLAENAAAPNGVPDAVWAGRQKVKCAAWRGGTECLFHLP